jgi:hypothetical protein
MKASALSILAALTFILVGVFDRPFNELGRGQGSD